MSTSNGLRTSSAGAAGLGVAWSYLACTGLPPSICGREQPANTPRTGRVLPFHCGISWAGHP